MLLKSILVPVEKNMCSLLNVHSGFNYVHNARSSEIIGKRCFLQTSRRTRQVSINTYVCSCIKWIIRSIQWYKKCSIKQLETASPNVSLK